MEQGIYLLSNDKVYDHVVALLNSIEANYSQDIPICIIPYDDNLNLIKQEIAKRKQVFLFEDQDSIKKWEKFIKEFQQIYLNYPHNSLIEKKTEVLTMHRKYCAFDGYFDKFIYIDTDTLVFKSLDHIFAKLEDYDLVVHDFQRKTDIKTKTVSYFFEVFSQAYESEESLSHRFHCGGFWASKKKAIDDDDLAYFLEEMSNGDARIFRTPWKRKETGGYQLSEQNVINYMTMKKNLSLYNFTLDKNSEHKTGCNVTSKHFQEKNHILYDQDKPLTYLHYMGVKNQRIAQLCKLEKMKIPFKNLIYKLGDKFLDWKINTIPYKDIFVYYRFLNEA